MPLHSESKICFGCTSKVCNFQGQDGVTKWRAPKCEVDEVEADSLNDSASDLDFNWMLIGTCASHVRALLIAVNYCFVYMWHSFK
jgi:hypothetical protein